MAEKLKAKTGGLDKAALKRCVTDINKHKEKASEYVGLSGKATSNAVETYGFDKKALTFVANLSRKEVSQQQATLGAIITYAEAMGMFEQMDMFNDAIGAMKAVIEKVGSATPASGGNVTPLSSAAAH